MIDHEKIKILLSADFDGEISDQERMLIDDHIKECKDCKNYTNEINKLSNTVKNWTDEDLSPDLDMKIRRNLLETSPREVPKMKNMNTYKRVGLVVATVLIVISLKEYIQKEHQIAKPQTPQLTINDFLRVTTKMEKDRTVKGNQQHKKTHLSSQLNVEAAGAYGSGSYDTTIVIDGMREKRNAGISFNQGYATERTLHSVNKSPQKKRRRMDDAISDQNFTPSAVLARKTEPYYWPVSVEAEGKYVEHIMPIPHPVPGQTSYDNRKFNTEQYNRIYENKFLDTKENPLSTFSIDVDTASYSNLRRILNQNRMPPEDSVRIEEMVNYFNYAYPKPEGDHPFSITTKASTCPWNKDHNMVMVGLKGKTMKSDEIPPSNLVFLLDVSGSMNQPNKLPLLKNAFRLLVNQLRDQERVAIVVYAGSSGKVLDSTPGSNKHAILDAINRLNAGGSTAGGAGIKLAYEIAKNNFIDGGNNRVILATDGDFNVGVSSDGELTRLIEEKRKSGIFLTVLGFGTGNYKDSKMEQLANKGNGNYFYIDTFNEAKKVLVKELGSTLFTIAKDVKLQIEFNPSQVKGYRLLGYENRILAKEDFNDDTKDAGELGAGHTVTAFYEIIPANSEETLNAVDELKYQKQTVVESNELMTVKLRYKNPDEDKSKLITNAIKTYDIRATASDDFAFATSVVEFGLMLRNSAYKGSASYQQTLNRARASQGKDEFGYRAEFIGLVEKAQSIDMRPNSSEGINFK